MKIAYPFYSIMLALVSTCASTCVLAADPPKPAAKPRAVAAEPAQDVEYADLDKYLGKRVIVHTKLDTTRSGVLIRHSGSEIDVKLDGGAELTVPATTIKRVSVPIGAPDPLFQKTGDAKPADAKASDLKPADAKPAETKPAGIKPAETKPADTKTKPSDSKTGDGKTGDSSAKKN